MNLVPQKSRAKIASAYNVIPTWSRVDVDPFLRRPMEYVLPDVCPEEDNQDDQEDNGGCRGHSSGPLTEPGRHFRQAITSVRLDRP